MKNYTRISVDGDPEVRLNEPSAEHDADWIIVSVGGDLDLVGTPEEFLALAEGIRDAAHTAEVMRMEQAVAR